MISLPNPARLLNKMELNQQQYDSLLERYIETIVDGMDLDSLIQFASEQMEINLRQNCSTPDELIEEIERVYDDEVLQDLLESVEN
jgi:predicted RNA-binding protein Jag